MTEYFSNIKDVLNGANFRTLKTDYARIIEDWADIVGKKFADKSEVSEIFNRGGKIYLLVQVKSSPLVQELGFFKKNLLKKINENYSVQISDIIIKANVNKAENSSSVKETEVLEIYDRRPASDELEKIELDKAVVDELKISVEKLTALSRKQKEKMLDIIITDLKTQEWMKKQGFPICKKCGRVMTRKTFGEENICNICKYNEIQEG